MSDSDAAVSGPADRPPAPAAAALLTSDPTSSPAPVASPRGRFYLIDALRGIAALMVLVCHLWNNAGWRQLEPGFPSWVGHLFVEFFRGVDIFFVISGFVIAYSIRNLVVGPATAANFALRRQVRLDPPYWTCTLIFWAMALWGHHRDPSNPTVGVGTAMANLFYLQEILKLKSIDPVAWTLCLEVQFYLVFICLVWLAQRLGRPQVGRIGLTFGLGVAGLVYNALKWPADGWFIEHWHLFALGAVTYWTVTRQAHWALVGILCMGVAARGFHYQGEHLRYHLMDLVGPITAMGILAVERFGLDGWFGGAVLRYFATISYSLYLVHFHLIALIFRNGIRLTGHSAASGNLWALMAAVIVVGVAHVLWRFVERPAKQWSSSLKGRRAPHPLPA
jgi:peptidoglycan/LPS O-acetylase OafA/YrhL